MTFAESDWEQESDYARFVLEPPSAEDLRHKADLDRKREKEEGPDEREAERS